LTNAAGFGSNKYMTSDLSEKAAALVAAVRARGSDAKDPRDAAHEACHALKWDVEKRWTRNNIHRKKPQLRSNGLADEILARAVEQLVSADVGYDCDTVEHWAMVCWMEMLKNERISLPIGDWLEKAIRSCMESSEARKWADQVLALIKPTETQCQEPST